MPKRAARYNLIALGGLTVSVATLAVMIRMVGLHPMTANIFALMASFAVNYVANKRFTFIQRDDILATVPNQTPQA